MTKSFAIYTLLKCANLRTRAQKIIAKSINVLSAVSDEGKEEALEHLQCATEIIVEMEDLQIDAEFALDFDCQNSLLN